MATPVIRKRHQMTVWPHLCAAIRLAPTSSSSIQRGPDVIRILVGCFLVLALSAVSADITLATAQFERGEYKVAHASFEKLARNSKNPGLLYQLALSQYKVRDNKGALSTLEEIDEQAKETPEVQYLLGSAYLARVNEVSVFRKLGFAKDALDAWERSVTLDPASAKANFAVFAYYVNAPGIAGGDLEVAASKLGVLRQIDRGYGALAEGILRLRQERLAEAEPLLKEAARLIKTRGIGHFTLAEHYLDVERYAEARDAIGQFRLSQKSWEDPDALVITFFDAQALAGLGEVAAARQSFESILGSDAEEWMIDETKKALKKLR